LAVTGMLDTPAVGVLRRYHCTLQHAREDTFAAFLRDSLSHCTFAVTAEQVTVTGNAITAGYTAGQWHAISRALSEALSALGPVTVVITPPPRVVDTPHAANTGTVTTVFQYQEGERS
jgi:hypothetical protein